MDKQIKVWSHTMNNKKKKEPWRILVSVASLLFILFLWVKKDIAAIYATMPSEQALPLIVTTVAVSCLKVAAMAGVLLLAKWLIGKIKRK